MRASIRSIKKRAVFARKSASTSPHAPSLQQSKTVYADINPPRMDLRRVRTLLARRQAASLKAPDQNQDRDERAAPAKDER